MPPAPIVTVTYLQAFILGLVQGVTEFLPVSSTAHMRILPALLHTWDASWPSDPGTPFSAVVQLGPIVGIIAYFRSDILKYVAGLGRSIQKKQLFPEGDLDARLGWFTVFGTIPLIIAGLGLEKKIDHEYRNLLFVSAALIFLAIILFVAERISRRNRDLRDLTLAQAMIVGFAQVLALVPGASRSGVTYTAALFLGLNRDSAIRFSFLLSIPAITLAGLYKLVKVLHATHLGHAAGPYVFSAIVAGIFAYIVVRWLMKYLGRDDHSMMPFIVYRIVLGLALLYLLHIHFLVPG